MAHLALNKSSLHREVKRLKGFQRYLPSLDLKRRQLIAERAKAAHALTEGQARLTRLEGAIGHLLPMLADNKVSLEGLVRVEQVEVEEENLLGTHLPILGAVTLAEAHYPLLGKPVWVDNVAEQLRTAIRLRNNEPPYVPAAEEEIRIPQTVDLDEDVPEVPRIPMTEAAPMERIRDFREVELGFSREEAMKEACRCLRCDISAVIEGQEESAAAL